MRTFRLSSLSEIRCRALLRVVARGVGDELANAVERQSFETDWARHHTTLHAGIVRTDIFVKDQRLVGKGSKPVGAGRREQGNDPASHRGCGVRRERIAADDQFRVLENAEAFADVVGPVSEKALVLYRNRLFRKENDRIAP